MNLLQLMASCSSATFRHSEAPLSFGIFHHTLLEVGVCVNFNQSLLQEIYRVHQCLHSACVVAEEDVRASLLDLTAAWAERA